MVDYQPQNISDEPTSKPSKKNTVILILVLALVILVISLVSALLWIKAISDNSIIQATSTPVVTQTVVVTEITLPTPTITPTLEPTNIPTTKPINTIKPTATNTPNQFTYNYLVTATTFTPDPDHYVGFEKCQDSSCIVYGVDVALIANAVIGDSYTLSFNTYRDCTAALGYTYCIVNSNFRLTPTTGY